MRHRSSSAPIFAMPNSNLHSNSLILSGYLNRPYPTPTLCVFHLGFGLGPHALRHTYATMWLRNGGGLAQLQKMLGHKDLATTQIYEHLVNDDVSQAQQKFAPTAAMGIFGPSRIIRGNEAGGDTVSGNGDAGNVAGFPLFMTPAAILKIRADRD